MGSIHLVYDVEGDIPDVDFRLTGETPRRGIEPFLRKVHLCTMFIGAQRVLSLGNDSCSEQ